MDDGKYSPAIDTDSGDGYACVSLILINLLRISLELTTFLGRALHSVQYIYKK